MVESQATVHVLMGLQMRYVACSGCKHGTCGQDSVSKACSTYMHELEACALKDLCRLGASMHSYLL